MEGQYLFVRQYKHITTDALIFGILGETNYPTSTTTTASCRVVAVVGVVD